ncbi:MAG: hypothetical protein FJ308_24585, partial [Planctomycetes bacterium]|nr:hypothetical protein [Planctomycetota bacterium]
MRFLSECATQSRNADDETSAEGEDTVVELLNPQRDGNPPEFNAPWGRRVMIDEMVDQKLMFQIPIPHLRDVPERIEVLQTTQDFGVLRSCTFAKIVPSVAVESFLLLGSLGCVAITGNRTLCVVEHMSWNVVLKRVLPNKITAMRWVPENPIGSTIALGTNDGSLHLIGVSHLERGHFQMSSTPTTGTILSKKLFHTSAVLHVLVRGHYALASSSNSEFGVWSLETGIVRIMNAYPVMVGFDISDDSGMCIAHNSDSSPFTFAWDAGGAPNRLKVLSSCGSALDCLALKKPRSHAISLHRSGMTFVWDLRELRMVQSIRLAEGAISILSSPTDHST